MTSDRREPEHDYPDHALSSEDIRALNAWFYRKDPTEYFQYRLNQIVIVAGNPSGYVDLLKTSPQFGDVTAGWEDSDEDEELSQRIVATDTELLQHHVSETLFRLIRAHQAATLVKDPCPWLELPFITFGSFKRWLASLLSEESSDQLEKWIEWLVFPPRGVVEPEGVGSDQWSGALKNVTAYITVLGRHLLANANLYNAAKHGLAVAAGEASAAIAHPDVAIRVEGQGPALGYVEIVRDPSDRRVLQHTHTWVDAQTGVSLVLIALALIRCLWAMAGARYGARTEVALDTLMLPFRLPPAEELVNRTGQGEVRAEMTKLSVDIRTFADIVRATDVSSVDREPPETIEPLAELDTNGDEGT